MRFSLGSGFLYINKHVCKQICPVWLQGRKDCFSCYSFSLPMNNLFCRPWFCLLTSSGRYLPLFLLRLSNNAVVSRCCCFSARGKLISCNCASSLLPPRLLDSPAALLVFPCRYISRLGPAFKYAVLKFIVQLAAVLLNFISLLGQSRFDESARSSRVHTNKFIHLVVAENDFLLGPALKYAVLKFLVRLRPCIHLVVAENNYSTSVIRFGFRVSL